jgi:hypothetical protein
LEVRIGLALDLSRYVVGRWRTSRLVCFSPIGGGLTPSPTVVEFGEVPAGEKIHATVVAHNISWRARRLLGCQRSCACLAVDTFPMIVAPGESVELKISLMPPLEAGSFAYELKYFMDSPDKTVERVTIRGLVRP